MMHLVGGGTGGKDFVNKGKTSWRWCLTQGAGKRQVVFINDTPWKFNIAPENEWLEDEFPFGKAYCQGLC